VNALWNRWRKPLDRPSVPARLEDPGLSPHLTAHVRGVLSSVSRPCAAIIVGGAATSATQSFLTGHPYLPDGVDWPAGDQGPQIFIGQINFAEIGELPGFPNSGLLQWFVDTDDCFGLSFDETAGAEGFTVRWYSDLSAPSVAEPDAATPTGHLDDLPMEFVGPTALSFRAGISIPAWAELSTELQQDRVWERVGIALDKRRSEPESVYDARIRRGSSELTDYRNRSKIGGYPTFTQTDPRGSGSYPALGSPAAGLLIELDSIDVGGWGDSGIAHLFGDAAALQAGDTSGVRYHWDCL
jgi:uncharacterized protein YwqG